MCGLYNAERENVNHVIYSVFIEQEHDMEISTTSRERRVFMDIYVFHCIATSNKSIIKLFYDMNDDEKDIHTEECSM